MEQLRQGFLDRPMRRKWLLYVSGLLIAIGLIVYAMGLWNARTLRNDAQDALRKQIKQEAQALAHTIAVTSRQDILSSNYRDLQSYFSDIVGQENVHYLIIMNRDGVAVVHTDARFRGKKLTDDTAKKALDTREPLTQDLPKDHIYDVAVPVMGYTSEAAVVRVGVSYGGVEGMFRK